jgi:hypothetical protein
MKRAAENRRPTPLLPLSFPLVFKKQKIFQLFSKKVLTNLLGCGIIPALSKDSRFR